jgi:WD40 repeat protein
MAAMPAAFLGRYLLLATLNSTVRIVDFEAGKVAKTYASHSSKEFCTPVAFITSVGPYIVAASEDGGLVIYDVNTRQVSLVDSSDRLTILPDTARALTLAVQMYNCTVRTVADGELMHLLYSGRCEAVRHDCKGDGKL